MLPFAYKLWRIDERTAGERHTKTCKLEDSRKRQKANVCFFFRENEIALYEIGTPANVLDWYSRPN